MRKTFSTIRTGVPTPSRIDAESVVGGGSPRSAAQDRVASQARGMPPLLIACCQILIFVSLLATIGSTLRVYPDQLAYFNELAGGPENGHQHLLHSNLDWGQDVDRCWKLVKELWPSSPICMLWAGGERFHNIAPPPHRYVESRYADLSTVLGQTEATVVVSVNLLQNAEVMAPLEADATLTPQSHTRGVMPPGFFLFQAVRHSHSHPRGRE